MGDQPPPASRLCLDCPAELPEGCRRDTVVCKACKPSRNRVRTRWKRWKSALGEIDNTKSSAELTALMDEEQGKRKASGKTSDAPPGSVGRSPSRKKTKPGEGDGDGEEEDEDEVTETKSEEENGGVVESEDSLSLPPLSAASEMRLLEEEIRQLKLQLVSEHAHGISEGERRAMREMTAARVDVSTMTDARRTREQYELLEEELRIAEEERRIDVAVLEMENEVAVSAAQAKGREMAVAAVQAASATAMRNVVVTADVSTMTDARRTGERNGRQLEPASPTQHYSPTPDAEIVGEEEIAPCLCLQFLSVCNCSSYTGEPPWPRAKIGDPIHWTDHKAEPTPHGEERIVSPLGSCGIFIASVRRGNTIELPLEQLSRRHSQTTDRCVTVPADGVLVVSGLRHSTKKLPRPTFVFSAAVRIPHDPGRRRSSTLDLGAEADTGYYVEKPFVQVNPKGKKLVPEWLKDAIFAKTAYTSAAQDTVAECVVCSKPLARTKRESRLLAKRKIFTTVCEFGHGVPEHNPNGRDGPLIYANGFPLCTDCNGDCGTRDLFSWAAEEGMELSARATVLQAEFWSFKAWWHGRAHMPLRYVGEHDPQACTGDGVEHRRDKGVYRIHDMQAVSAVWGASEEKESYELSPARQTFQSGFLDKLD